MRKTIISIAIASALTVSTSHVIADQYSEDTINNDYSYTAMGIGAAGGALVAGPVGLVIGGVVGSLFGQQGIDDLENMEQGIEGVEIIAESDTETSIQPEANNEPNELMVASSNDLLPVNGSEQLDASDRIKQIIARDLNMAVYFKPGSVDFESFYSRQFSTISNLLHEMPELELNLDGYSDRQGSQDDNLQLSAERLESVRDYFINSGIDESRINVRAYGEKNFVSTPGELDSYVFDRRVVVSFRESTKNSQNSVAIVKQASPL